MGNICRSPTAEGIFRHRAARAGLADRLRTDSAGTHSYHIGSLPDDRAVAAAAARGVDITGLRARRIKAADFREFDLVLAMDDHNMALLEELRATEGQGTAELRLMMSYSPRFANLREVPDPYYGGRRDFEHMCDLLEEACDGLLGQLQR